MHCGTARLARHTWRVTDAQFPYLDVPFVAMAHRGGALTTDSMARENTMLAFSNAVQLGYRYLETDVHLTSDGVLVLFHDDDLTRLTGEPGRIEDMTLADLKSIKIGGTESICTLDELLDAFDEVNVNIDMKQSNTVAPLAQAIESHNAFERVCVASFSGLRLRRFRKLVSKPVATAASPLAVGVSGVVPAAARFVGGSSPVWQMPLTQAALGHDWTLFSAKVLDTLHKLGKKVHIWTIDDAETMHALIDAGVDGLITDRPDTLKSVLVARGMWYG